MGGTFRTRTHLHTFRTHLQNTPSGLTQDTPRGHTFRMHLQDTPSEHTLDQSGYTSRTHLQDALPGHTFRTRLHVQDRPSSGHTLRTLLQGTPRDPGHIFRTQPQDTPSGHASRTHLQDTPSGHNPKSHLQDAPPGARRDLRGHSTSMTYKHIACVLACASTFHEPRNQAHKKSKQLRITF